MSGYGWTPYGDGTLDRLDAEHAAQLRGETDHNRRLELRHETARRHRHRFVPDDLFPDYCDHCGIHKGPRHENWQQ